LTIFIFYLAYTTTEIYVMKIFC